jgi:2'-5' RNA ligase
MSYVVIAFPEISQNYFEWIQDIRKTHDRQFGMIEPHFTIIFPTAKLSEEEMLKHIESFDLDTQPFTFKLTTAVVEENTFNKSFQIHLVADELIHKLVKLHDLLYTGILESEHRHDILYTPHITIAGSEEKSVIQKLADEINAKGLSIHGQINEITVGSFDGTKVSNIKEYQLK